jgi:hypothetical protein
MRRVGSPSLLVYKRGKDPKDLEPLEYEATKGSLKTRLEYEHEAWRI